MIIDSLLQFDPPATAVTVTAVSTNVLDLVNNRDLGIGKYKLSVMCLVGTAFTSATASATLNIQLQGAPDNGSGAAGGYSLIGESGVVPLGQLAAGYKVAQFPIPPVADAVGAIASPTLSTTSGSTSATVSSATGILQGQFITSSGVVPGTTVSSISGTAVTLSANASATTTTVASAFTASEPPYRFLRLNYVASATMTAGTVNSFLVGDADEVVNYRSGITVAN